MLRNAYLIIVFLLLHAGLVTCAPKPVPTNKKPVTAARKPAILQYDTVKISERAFESLALKRISREEAFQYDESYQGISFLERFWIWFWSLFNADKRGMLATGIIYLLMALGVAAIVFLILKLAGVDAMKILRGKPASNALPYSENAENIHELNLDDEIERAVTAQNFRFAVRMLYLKCLKQLNEAGLINWELNKTNAQYSHELRDVDQRMEFNLLTRQFEYIWYGEFDLDANIFTRVRSLFNDFKVKR